MKRVINIIYISILTLLTTLVTGCIDDPLYSFDDEAKEGEAVVNIEASFEPSKGVALTTRTAGDAINEIEGVFIGLYDTKTEKLVKSYYYDGSNGMRVNALEERDTGGDDNDPICKATINNVVIPYGTYYAMAVANMGDLYAIYGEEIETLDGLRTKKLVWEPKDISANDQMSGYFLDEKTSDAPGSLKNDNKVKPISIHIGGNTRYMHAWLRRAASKVTVSFDGSKLNQDVTVYIKSIKVKDCAPEMMLFNESKITDKKDLIAEGEGIILGEGDNYKTWPQITRGDNTYLTDWMGGKDVHAYNSKASLFFYENMQGKGKSKHQIDPDNEKAPDSRPTYPEGTDPNNEYWKDCVDKGTYVEVEAYYESYCAGNHSKGPIIYRFMLGKDVDYDYNVERNHHYKLTLSFIGNANDVDWHIDFREDSRFWGPSPYYISYLYGKDMYLPIQVQGPVERLEAKILYNHWYAEGETPLEQSQLNSYNGSASPYNVYWGGDYTYKTSHTGTSADKEDRVDGATCMGFLSLRYEGVRSMELEGNLFNENGGVATTGAKHIDDDWYTHDLGHRTYYNPFEGKRAEFLAESNQEKYKGVYIIEDETLNNSKRYVFQLPMYTRALNLVTCTSFTGNNPFFNYVRKAKVRIRAYDVKNEPVLAYDPVSGQEMTYLDVEIIQVRRIINPKGIFRHADNADPFHVVLMERKGDIVNGQETKYEPFKSHGSWKVSVKAGADWIRIGKNSNPSSTNTIYGDTETEIDFWYKPEGPNKTGKPRSGLIEVTYNNNTCVHMIVVKQGYEPLQILSKRDSGTPLSKWSMFNMRSKTKMAESPLEEGSLFRSDRVDFPIDPSTLWNTTMEANSTVVNIYKDGSTLERKTWTSIGSAGTSDSFPNFEAWEYQDGGEKYRIAELQDFFYLRNVRTTNAVTEDIDISYGIVYGDGAKECQTDPAKAHGYKYTEATTSGDYPTSPNGMRGCIVYNNGSIDRNLAGNSVFFPSGVTGYGRIKSDASGPGVYWMMQYAGAFKRNVPITTNMNYRPLLHRLDKNYGMMYWHRRHENSGFGSAKSSAWDFNMSTFDFNMLQDNGLSSAGFVRMVLYEGQKYKSATAKTFPNY